MALSPKFAGQRIGAGAASSSVHTLELFLDYVCPFSKKLFDTVYADVIPLIEKKYQGKVSIIFRQLIQPWHPSSTLVHEAGVAVLRLSPSKFYDFSSKLFAQQKDFFDASVVHEARNETYKRLAKIAASAGVDEQKTLDLLVVSDKPDKDGGLNGGNGVTNDLKLLVKAARLQGVHVTPTVLFDGIEEKSISSSFTKDDWEKWFEKNVV